MKLLNIDTSTKHFSLAVSDQEKIVRSRNIFLDKVLSKSIVPSIDRILKSSEVRLDQLDGFAVGLGPGSFTSLRVGLSSVKALAFSTQKPVIGIASLDVIAANPRLEDEICTICDARRGLVYGCLYQKKNRKLTRKSPYLLTGINDIIKRASSKTLFVGDAVVVYREALEARFRKRLRLADNKDAFPQARNLVPLALRKLAKGRGDNVRKLVPLYLYPQDCQVRR